LSFSLCLRAANDARPAAGSDRSPAAVTYLRVFLIVGLLRPNPSADEVVSHGVGDGEVEVERGRGVSVLHLGVMEVTIELLLHCRHIFQLGDPTDGYLFPSVGGGPRTCWVAKLSHGRQLRSLRCQFRTTAFCAERNATRMRTQNGFTRMWFS